jgi:hypothetical protein
MRASEARANTRELFVISIIMRRPIPDHSGSNGRRASPPRGRGGTAGEPDEPHAERGREQMIKVEAAKIDHCPGI